MRVVDFKATLPPRQSRIVSAWMRDRKAVPLECERSTEGMVCPDCEGEDWLTWRDGGVRVAACAHWPCVAAHLDGIPPKVVKRRRFGLPDADAPSALYGACMGDSWQPEAVKGKMVRWLGGREPFVLLTGGCGRGKTWTACALIDEWQARSGLGALFAPVVEVHYRWLQEFSETGLKRVLSRLDGVDFLVLDDMGQRAPTEPWLDALYMLVNSRLNNERKTVITTNLNESQLVSTFGQRIASRLFSGVGVVLEGGDGRL